MRTEKKLIEEIKTAIKNNELIIGKERVFKDIKKGDIKKVFLASNCPESIKEDIMHYSKIGRFEVAFLKRTAEEFGILCKKPFGIAVCAIRKVSK